MSQERRDSYRFALEKGQAVVDLGIPEAAGLILDICASGSAIVLSSEHAEDLWEKPVTVRLENHPPFSIRLIPERIVKKDASQTVVGVRFGSMSHGAAASLSQFLIEKHLGQHRTRLAPFEEGEKVQRHLASEQVLGLLLYYAVSQARTLQVYRDGRALPLRFRVREMNMDESQQSMVLDSQPGSLASLKKGEQCTFAFAGSHALNYFCSVVQNVGAGIVSISFPREIRQARFRDSRRIRLNPDQRCPISFEHPRLLNLTLEKQAYDVGGRGLSFLLDTANDALFPGERILEIIAHLPEKTVRFEAVIRGLEESADGLICGLEILRFATDSDRERWQQFVFHLVHPGLKLACSKDLADIWRVLDLSGYQKEVTEPLLPQLTQKYFASWGRHGDEARLSRFFLVSHAETPVGTMSTNLIYPGTWLIHNFGIDETLRKKDRRAFYHLAREIYSGINFIMRHLASCQFYLLYVDASKKWNDLIYGRFLRNYPRKEEFLYDHYKVFKYVLKGQAGANQHRSAGVLIKQDDERMLSKLSKHLHATLPAIEYEAFCYDEQRLSLNAFSQECKAVGYERRRRIFIAVQGDNMRAALIAETGDEGINIFGLFNKCWLVCLDPDAAHEPAIQELLLGCAKRYYADQGKPEFIFLGDIQATSSDALAHLGFVFVADGLRWLARKEIIPAYLNYTDELLEMIHG